jgi:hypothetical protein
MAAAIHLLTLWWFPILFTIDAACVAVIVWKIGGACLREIMSTSGCDAEALQAQEAPYAPRGIASEAFKLSGGARRGRSDGIKRADAMAD